MFRHLAADCRTPLNMVTLVYDLVPDQYSSSTTTSYLSITSQTDTLRSRLDAACVHFCSVPVYYANISRFYRIVFIAMKK